MLPLPRSLTFRGRALFYIFNAALQDDTAFITIYFCAIIMKMLQNTFHEIYHCHTLSLGWKKHYKFDGRYRQGRYATYDETGDIYMKEDADVFTPASRFTFLSPPCHELRLPKRFPACTKTCWPLDRDAEAFRQVLWWRRYIAHKATICHLRWQIFIYISLFSAPLATGLSIRSLYWLLYTAHISCLCRHFSILPKNSRQFIIEDIAARANAFSIFSAGFFPIIIYKDSSMSLCRSSPLHERTVNTYAIAWYRAGL